MLLKKRNLKGWKVKMKLYKPLFETQDDIKINDEILMGKFKNKLAIVKGFETDDKGQPVIFTDKGKTNLYKVRIKKLMPKKENIMKPYKSVIESVEGPASLNVLLKKIEKMTDQNSHGEARLEIAKFFKIKKFIDIFTYILKLHSLEGSLDYNLMKYREQKTSEMLAVID